MNFGQCACCGLNLPRTYLIPVLVNHQGKRIKVLICDRCKEIKEKEAKERK